MAESEYFKQQKKKGRWFEGELEKVLIEKGFEVVDSEKLKYKDKKGWDREVTIKGERAKIEMKFDEMSEATGNVCLEISAIRQSISPTMKAGQALFLNPRAAKIRTRLLSVVWLTSHM